MQIRYSKTENWNCETAGTKKSKVNPCTMKHSNPCCFQTKLPD